MNKKLIICLLVPIISLLSLTASKAYKAYSGKKFTLDIVGFDPRDLLSGHYLIYRIKYLDNEKRICNSKNNGRDVYYCFDNKQASTLSWKLSKCIYKIKGTCSGNRFKAGIERFYIPDEYAVELDRVIRDQKGKIILSVNRQGSVQVSNLLIENIDWKEYLRNSPKK
jgi:uncharacterized membrane-anchored protein